jgi:hypothetical protein
VRRRRCDTRKEVEAKTRPPTEKKPMTLAELIKELNAYSEGPTWHWDKVCSNAASMLEAQDTEITRLRAALSELVACKNLKDELTRMQSDPYYVTKAGQLELEYDRRKPAAWKAAQEALAPNPAPRTTPRLNRWVMHDNHTFTSLDANDGAAFAKIMECFDNDRGWIMLCGTWSDERRERRDQNRRRPEPLNAHGVETRAKFVEEAQQWLQANPGV